MENKTFADNLRFLREKFGMTQKTLAEALGFSEKSVSKWETGGGLPTAECLVEMSRLFGTTLDELLFGYGCQSAYLGVDGGGTKTVFLLVDESGRTLRRLERGPMNPNDIGIPAAKELLYEGVEEVRSGIPKSRISAFFGIAGCGVAKVGEEIDAYVSNMGFAHVGCDSDIANVTAITVRDSGVVAILGTGFVAYAREGEKRHRVAGWGQFFDDGGSGYNIGRDGIAAVLREHDGSGGKTIIRRFCEEKTGQRMDDHLSSLYFQGKKYIASFAPCVFSAAEFGDETAQAILRRNMHYAAEMIRAAAAYVSASPVPVYLAGGLTAHEKQILPYMEEILPKTDFHIHILREEPVLGAVAEARRLAGKEPFPC